MRRIIYTCIAIFFSTPVFAARSIFEGKNGECGIAETNLRNGNIHMGQIPCILLNITNNLLSFVGYISLMIIVFGSVQYTLGGLNEEWKSKGKEAVKMAVFGAVVSWSGWFLVNFVLDNVT